MKKKDELEEINRGSTLSGFSDESMSIYDVALLAECQQIIDSENQSRHNVEVVVKDIRDIILPDLSVFDRIHSTIISMIEESLVEEFDEEDC